MAKIFEKLKKFFYRLFMGRFAYIPMRLPVEKITSDFERSLRKKVDNKLKNFTIREAKEKDIDILIELFDKAWHSTTMPFRPLNRNKIIDKILTNPDALFLIANVGGEDTGFILIDFVGSDKNIGEISALGILPEHQSKGIGTLLGLKSWEYFKERNVEELICKVYMENEKSKSFLERMGFEVDPRRNTDTLYMKKSI